MNFQFSRKVRVLFTKDVRFTFQNQIWRTISGPVLLLLMLFYLDQETQGFWYTFIGISALAIFADLGFSNIICQFAAHEFAFLSFDNQYQVKGPEENKLNLYSLLEFVLKWSVLISLIAFSAIFSIGYAIFIGKETIAFWLLPWIIYSIGSLLAFLNGVIASFIQGCNQIASVQRASLLSAFVFSLIVFMGLLMHFGLYSLSIAILISNLVYTFILLIRYRNLFRGCLASNRGTKKWAGEIAKLLWKYAISFSSGYIVFQMYTPLLFQFYGPVEAGKVGITMSLVSAIFNISNSWFSSALPRINMYVAKREWSYLDKEFRKDLVLSCMTYILGLCVLLCSNLLFIGKWELYDRIVLRFLGVIPLSMLCICWLLQLFQNGMAIYLRAHKQEPFLAPSLANGIFVLVTTYLSLRFLSPSFLFLGFLTSFCYSLPWCTMIFSKKRQEWHT